MYNRNFRHGVSNFDRSVRRFNIMSWVIYAFFFGIGGFVVYMFVVGIGSGLMNGEFGNSTLDTSWGYNGLVETRCIEGTKWTVTAGQYNTQTTQILGRDGKPVPCR